MTSGPDCRIVGCVESTAGPLFGNSCFFLSLQKVNPVKTIIRPRRDVVEDPRQLSAVARYHRIAQLETVLTIRARQQQRMQRTILWSAVVLMTALGSATVLGFL